jgi:hypothetical protein
MLSPVVHTKRMAHSTTTLSLRTMRNQSFRRKWQDRANNYILNETERDQFVAGLESRPRRHRHRGSLPGETPGVGMDGTPMPAARNTAEADQARSKPGTG